MEIKYRRKPLSLEEKMRLATDYNAGMAINDLMERYGISRVTVFNYLRQLSKIATEKTEEGN